MHPFAAATAPSLLVLLLLLLFSLSTTQYSVADANYNEISPISTDSHINQVIFDPDHPNSSLPLLIHNNKNEDEETYVFNITAPGKFIYFMKLQLVLKDHKDAVEAYGTPDTGSDLIWLNLTCKTSTTAAAAAATHACIEIKEPETTFKCEDEECKDMRSYLRMKDDKCIKSTDHKDKCEYKIRYKDDSDSKGYFGKGGFRVSHDQEFEMQYGVSTGTVPEEKMSKGVVGLGRGKLSLFQQLKDVVFKFSYCLPQYEKIDDSNKKAQYATGKLVFGSQVSTCFFLYTRDVSN